MHTFSQGMIDFAPILYTQSELQTSQQNASSSVYKMQTPQRNARFLVKELQVHQQTDCKFLSVKSVPLFHML
jgi:hypothetical protein